MDFTTKQLRWLERAEAKDLMKVRPRLTKKQYEEVEKKWKEIKALKKQILLEKASNPEWWDCQ